MIDINQLNARELKSLSTIPVGHSILFVTQYTEKLAIQIQTILLEQVF